MARLTREFFNELHSVGVQEAAQRVRERVPKKGSVAPLIKALRGHASELQEEGNSERLIHFVRVLGKARVRSLDSFVQAQLFRGTIGLRVAAVKSLRDLQHSQGLKFALSDEDERVWKPAAAALARVALRGSDEDDRRDAVNALVAAHGVKGGQRPVLSKLLRLLARQMPGRRDPRLLEVVNRAVSK
ncbi:TPA: hypothetical protein HA318_01680 [Candidatus Micrarchaeota archaeon]|nr:MAG: hypothetical protein AUJ65_05300 [Candidatus Micrarchaeota archaeon CG1_02_51_15]HII38694.1 hypothetical protein [Candidatus Micrarchaeota archaeon]